VRAPNLETSLCERPCGLHDRSPRGLRQFSFDETFLGIQVVVTRFVNHANSPVARGFRIRNRHVDLAALQRHFVPRVVEADHKPSGCSCHDVAFLYRSACAGERPLRRSPHEACSGRRR
jgi:hypothetical protein